MLFYCCFNRQYRNRTWAASQNRIEEYRRLYLQFVVNTAWVRFNSWINTWWGIVLCQRANTKSLCISLIPVIKKKNNKNYHLWFSSFTLEMCRGRTHKRMSFIKSLDCEVSLVMQVTFPYIRNRFHKEWLELIKLYLCIDRITFFREVLDKCLKVHQLALTKWNGPY